jgi:hypothetical protein
MILHTLSFCWVLFQFSSEALLVEVNNTLGTESLPNELTEKQLAIQRWFSQLTFLQNLSDWGGWGNAADDLDCDGNTCIRYEIAGLAYSAAVIAKVTPAYTQVVEDILYNSIVRMTDKRVYQYIELFDDFTSQPTYPDPVAYKNIMYSGHLAQVRPTFYLCFFVHRRHRKLLYAYNADDCVV